jgi:hypothetical protein
MARFATVCIGRILGALLILVGIMVLSFPTGAQTSSSELFQWSFTRGQPS